MIIFRALSAVRRFGKMPCAFRLRAALNDSLSHSMRYSVLFSCGCWKRLTFHWLLPLLKLFFLFNAQHNAVSLIFRPFDLDALDFYVYFGVFAWMKWLLMLGMARGEIFNKHIFFSHLQYFKSSASSRMEFGVKRQNPYWLETFCYFFLILLFRTTRILQTFVNVSLIWDD